MRVKTKKLVCGVGINDAGYVVQKFETIEVGGKQKQKLVWMCDYYRAWKGMLRRCYDTKLHERQPTYKGCTVSDNWLKFTNFKAWMEKQDFEGKQLDKDLLIQGNKVYSAETCVFVTQMVNSFTIDRGNDRGRWMIGVYWNKHANKFQAICSNPFTKKQESLGYFDSEQDAHEAWLKRKLELARLLAAEQDDPRVAEALITRYTNYKTF